MAMACAPCVLGAASNLLSYPYAVVTATATVHPVVFNVNGTNITSTSTQYRTEYATSSGASPGLIFSAGAPLLWTTLGTELTYPNTYAQYFGFTGAAASTPPPAQCAETLAPTTVALASSTPLIYDITGQTGLPQALLAYLDSIPSFTAQLGNNAVASCAAATVAAVATSTLTNTRSFVLFNTTTSSTVLTTSGLASTSVTSIILTATSVDTTTDTVSIITTAAPTSVIAPMTVTTVMTVTGTMTFVPSGSGTVIPPSTAPTAIGDTDTSTSSIVTPSMAITSLTTSSTSTSPPTTSSTSTSPLTTSPTVTTPLTTSSTVTTPLTASPTVTTPLTTSSTVTIDLTDSTTVTVPFAASPSTTTVGSTSTVIVSITTSSPATPTTSSISSSVVAPLPVPETPSVGSVDSSVVSTLAATSPTVPSGAPTTTAAATITPYTGTGRKLSEIPLPLGSSLGLAMLMAFVAL